MSAKPLMTRLVLATLLALAVSGFSSYTTATVIVEDADEKSFAAAAALLNGLGYTDEAVTHPSKWIRGFRAPISLKGAFFVLLELDPARQLLRLSFSEGSSRLTPEAEKQFAAVVERMREQFQGMPLRIERP